MEDIRVRFDYIFAQSYFGGGLPLLDLHPVEGPFAVLGHTVVPVEVLHGQLPVYGYRFGPFAYVTDCSAIPEPSLALLHGLDVLILDALRHKPHPTHFNIAQALEVIAQLQPRRAFLTHLTHDVLHQRVAGELPEGVELAYDGLTFEVEWLWSALQAAIILTGPIVQPQRQPVIAYAFDADPHSTVSSHFFTSTTGRLCGTAS